jgi:hypothetical protein
MRGVRTAAVRDEQRGAATAGEVDEMEARLRRRRGKVGDRDPVMVRNPAAIAWRNSSGRTTREDVIGIAGARGNGG